MTDVCLCAAAGHVDGRAPLDLLPGRWDRSALEAMSDDAALRAIVEGVEAEVGESFFRSLVRHLSSALGVQYAFVSELVENGTHFRTRAVWERGQLGENFVIPLAGTPCEAVLHGEPRHYGDRLQERFPADVGLAKWSAESYCGVPLLDGTGVTAGHLAIIHDEPMPDGRRGMAILRIFAARAQAEIERSRIESALRESETRLTRIIDSALDAIVTFDEALRVELTNGAAERVFGRTSQTMLGQSLTPLLTEPLEQALRASIRELTAGPRTAAYLWAPNGLHARRANGSEFPLEATLSGVEVGARRLFTLILRDLDARRQAEETMRRLSTENQYLEEEIESVYHSDEIVGSSPAMAAVLEQVALVGPTGSSVLILGETGAGKELIARALHAASSRRERPLIKVNCAALPAGLVESELFGHERGAFTGAAQRRVGRFELADGGTIFLDEIGDLPADVQVKLLRVLQERELERIGGSTTIRVDVRIISATNRALPDAVAAGTFREDLYYRLNVFPISLPPLRERPGDVALLTHFFVARYAAKIGRRITHVPPDVMARLEAYPWPGNVRELENVIERAVILSMGPALEVRADVLPESVAAPVAPGSPDGGQRIVDVEREHVLSVLKQTGWRIEGPAGAAQALGMHPNTLRSRMKRLGIHRQPRT
jgi:PAS domain S-box-containing protein